MFHFILLTRLKAKIAAASLKAFLRGSRLRLVVMSVAAGIFWLLMFGMFLEGFTFLRDLPGMAAVITETLTQYMFAFFFFALLVMMTISSGVICYTSFYRNDEASFLMSLPMRPGVVYAHKAAESIVFTSWGMAVLVVPLFLAYGLVQHAPWYFYVLSFAFSALFIGIPMSLGAIAALLVPILIPRVRKVILGVSAAALATALVIWGLSMLGEHSRDMLTEVGVKKVMDRIAFCQHWALCSYWVSDGMLSALHPGDAGEGLGHSGFQLLLLLANVLFLGMFALWLGARLYPTAWARAHAGGSGPLSYSRIRARALDRFLSALLRFLPFRLRLLVVKDAKTFLRDPVQWSQCVLFFGLLALYILNMPRFGMTDPMPMLWRSLVSLLNLGVTCLVLSTFTSRFVFPQLSLEGRRIWVIGLIPMRRSTILWGKFVFAAMGSMLISGTLIVISDVMLKLPGWVMLIHIVVTACVCCGLSGLAVGLGACYPHMRSDNPSKIVSSFGGTLNLLCSIFFIVASVMLVAVPLHAHATASAANPVHLKWTGLALGLDVALAALACVLPMMAGVRTFNRMEF